MLARAHTNAWHVCVCHRCQWVYPKPLDCASLRQQPVDLDGNMWVWNQKSNSNILVCTLLSFFNHCSTWRTTCLLTWNICCSTHKCCCRNCMQNSKPCLDWYIWHLFPRKRKVGSRLFLKTSLIQVVNVNCAGQSMLQLHDLQREQSYYDGCHCIAVGQNTVKLVVPGYTAAVFAEPNKVW